MNLKRGPFANSVSRALLRLIGDYTWPICRSERSVILLDAARNVDRGGAPYESYNAR
jgi:hypothetical protein